MFVEFGPAPLCLELDFDLFDGPPHWVARLRQKSGWLMVAEATIQSEHDILTDRLVVACDEQGNPIPSFKAVNLVHCDWINPTYCDELPPDILEDLICEEEGALIARWHREKNTALAEAFDTQEIRVAELEARLQSMIARNEAQIAELRQRRRHPAVTPEMRSAMGQIIAELDDENDDLLQEMADTRAAIREQSAEIEEGLWGREDLLIEVQPLHLIRWRSLRSSRYAPPYHAKPASVLWTPEQSRLGAADGSQRAINRSLRIAQIRGFAACSGNAKTAVQEPAEQICSHEQLTIGLPEATTSIVFVQDTSTEQDSEIQQAINNFPSDCELSDRPALQQQPVESGWASERISLLRDLWFAGHSAGEIAKALGNTSRNAVLGKAKRLGLPRRGEILANGVGETATREPACQIGHQTQTNSSHWSPKCIELLEHHWLEGMPAENIARLLGMRKGQVIGKAHRLGLCNAARPKRGDEQITQTSPDTATTREETSAPAAVQNALSALSAARKRYYGQD